MSRHTIQGSSPAGKSCILDSVIMVIMNNMNVITLGWGGGGGGGGGGRPPDGPPPPPK